MLDILIEIDSPVLKYFKSPYTQKFHADSTFEQKVTLK